MMQAFAIIFGCLVASSFALFFVSSPDVPVHGPIPTVYSCGTADYPPYGYPNPLSLGIFFRSFIFVILVMEVSPSPSH
jgi:hypothetical protein